MNQESGWIFEPDKRHLCTTPRGRDLSKRAIGSIWRCGECGKGFVLVWSQADGKRLLVIKDDSLTRVLASLSSHKRDGA